MSFARPSRSACLADDEGESADVIDIMSVLKERMGAARGPARARASRSDDGAEERQPAAGRRRASKKRTSSKRA
jgi:hypothetical protein